MQYVHNQIEWQKLLEQIRLHNKQTL